MEMIGHGHEVTVDGTRIAWGELGDGPPLILLHGLRDSHRTWRRVAPLLADGFRVLMPDLPGHGLSGRPDAAYTLDWYARTLSAWLDAIGIERAHLCGHSFGGGIAQWLLLEGRHRVDRLGLVAPGGLGREVGMGLRLAALPILGPRLAPLVVRHLLPFVLLFARQTFGGMEPAEIVRAVRMNDIPGTERAFQRTVEGVINITGQYMQTIHRVREVASLPPIALFWGEEDTILPIAHGRATLARSTGITLHTYAGCGHYPHLQHPAAWAADLSAFLCDPARPPARLFSEEDASEGSERQLLVAAATRHRPTCGAPLRSLLAG